MSNYISRESIIKWIDDSLEQCGNRYTTDQLNMMEMFRTVINDCLPFANVVSAELYQRALNDVVTLSAERKHGKWKDSNYNLVWNADGVYKAAYQCSNCGACSPIVGYYCYNCGARMDGDSCGFYIKIEGDKDA